MFFVLSKILSFFVHPFSWILILIAIGYFFQRQGIKKWSFRLAFIGALFFTNTVIFSEVVRLWEPYGTPISEVGHYDVAIVLGGMAEYDNSLHRLSIRRGGDRLWQAMQLYATGHVKKIMIVGANGYLLDDALQEAGQFKEDLMRLGIPADDIITEEKSKNTYQNAVESKKVLANYPDLKSYLLVTSALHMNRAEACFLKAGFTDIGTFTTDHYTGKVRGYKLDQYFLPNVSNLSDWRKVLHEWVGYVSYKIAGYI
jgi:uncharacterized SAM-binding protein YcdF (DUF218 family)